jgi:hypothetical protein
MASLTVVLTAPGPVNLGAWCRELREQEFDMELDPTLPRYDDPRSVPVVICGRDAVFELDIVPVSNAARWFPIGMLQIRQPRQVARFEWRQGEVFEYAAVVAAATALSVVYKGAWFNADGLRAVLPPEGYRLARKLFANLPNVPGHTAPDESSGSSGV